MRFSSLSRPSDCTPSLRSDHWQAGETIIVYQTAVFVPTEITSISKQRPAKIFRNPVQLQVCIDIKHLPGSQRCVLIMIRLVFRKVRCNENQSTGLYRSQQIHPCSLVLTDMLNR